MVGGEEKGGEMKWVFWFTLFVEHVGCFPEAKALLVTIDAWEGVILIWE